MPINAGVSQMVKIGEQRVQFGGGLRYWADSPEFGPQDWGARLDRDFPLPHRLGRVLTKAVAFRRMRHRDARTRPRSEHQ